MSPEEHDIALVSMWNVLQRETFTPPTDPENDPVVLFAKLIHHPRLEGRMSDELTVQLLEIASALVLEDYGPDDDRPYLRLVK